jgi:hypothetical protein
MNDHRQAPALGKRDAIGAWLVCLAVAAACLGSLDAVGPARVDHAAAWTNPGPTVAAATHDRAGKRQC